MNVRRPGHPLTLLPAVAVVVLTVLVLRAGTTATSVHVDAVQMTSQYNGTNGVTALEVSALGPSVTVSAYHPAEPYGLFAGLSAVQELGQAGSVLASGNFSETGWTVTNESSAGTLAIVYSANMTVDHHGVETNNSPRALIAVEISVPGGGGTAISRAANVSFAVSITNWPWLHPKDSLALTMPIGAAHTATEQLASGGPNTMDCVAVDSGNAQERFTWSPDAVGTDASGDDIPVTPSSAVFGGGSNATLEVVIPGGSTGFVDVEYSVALSVVTHVATAAVPTLDVVGAVVLAAVGGGWAVLQVRRTWSRPVQFVPEVP